MSTSVQEEMERDVNASLQPVVNAFGEVCARIDSNIPNLKPEFNDVFMYATVYNIAVDPNYMFAEDGSHAVSEMLYVRYQEMLAKYAKTLASRVSDGSPSHLVRVRCWRKYKMALRWMRKAFDYLSRYFLHETGKNSKYPSLDEVGRAVFFNCCLKKAVSETRRAVLDLVIAARNDGQMTVPWSMLGERAGGPGGGGADDGGCSITALCKDTVELFVAMSLSSQPAFFEDHFLHHYIRLLKGELSRLAQVQVAEGAGPAAFIHFASMTLREERDRAAAILPSEALVQRVVEALEGAILDLPLVVELLFNEAAGVLALMNEGGHFEEVGELFLLLRGKALRLDPLASAFQKHVEFVGAQLLDKRAGSDSELNPTDCISDLVVFHKHYVGLVTATFHGHRAFVSALRNALGVVISRGFDAKAASSGKSSTTDVGSVVISTSELLASYCHQVISGSHESADAALKDAVTLLEFAGNRDLFLLHTKSLLARRLLSPMAHQQLNNERQLISRLKVQFGHQFSHGLSSMLADKEVALKFNESFQAEVPLSQASFEFNALALKSGVWPSRSGNVDGLSSSRTDEMVVTERPIEVPRSIQMELKLFEHFHQQNAPRKALRWAHHLGTATLQCQFNNQLKDITMTAFQAMILIKFNDKKVVSFEELMAIGLTADEIRNSTKGLLRLKLLVPSPTSRSSLMVNEKFSNPARKIQVPSGEVLVSVETSKKLHNAAANDRKPIVQATVMKTMKGRRQLSHTELVNECMRQLSSQKITIEAKSITEAIRILLEREYLERHPDNHTLYRYVA